MVSETYDKSIKTLLTKTLLHLKMGKRAPKNRSTKTSIVFDEAARTEYLTGFRKRKESRRKKAKEQMEKEIKEEIKKAK